MGPMGGNSGFWSFPIPMPILINDIFLVIAFYTNLFFLMPKLFNAKRWGFYVFFTLFFMACSLYIHRLTQSIEFAFWQKQFEIFRQQFEHSHPHGMGEGFGPRGGFQGMHESFGRPEDFTRMARNRGFEFRQFSFLYLFIMTWAISMVYYLFVQLQQSARRAEQVLSTALQSELSFLKAQINPHFLFNTLNNIYVLTLKKSESAPKAVMKLSNLMRTLTNDTGVDVVAFSEEEQFIRDYLELQQLRLTETTKVQYGVEGDFSRWQIAPRILIPFIDNAFKYGVSNREPSVIRIQLTFEGDNLTFEIENAIHPDAGESLESAGVGLGNSKRRLELLYKDRYELTITETEKHHRVVLKLRLK